MKKIIFIVLTGAICTALCVILLNQHVNRNAFKMIKNGNVKLVSQIKLDSKHKIVTVPMPNKDSKKYIVNKMPTKFGQVVIKNLTIK